MKRASDLFRCHVILGHLKRHPASNASGQPSRLMASDQSSNSNVGDVLVSHVGTKRIITLSRPKALNALSLHMIKKMYPLVKDLSLNSGRNVEMLILKGEGGKAFCAGGDVRSITEAARKGDSLAQDFFREEYNLNYSLGTCRVPVVALIDGITMGGGVGISVHGPFRVATERTLFAMPETAIGFFPDVGGSYFMSRMRGKLGLYLALTGVRLRGRDCLEAGIATHYIDSKLLKDLESELLAIVSGNVNKASIDQVLSKFQKQSIANVPYEFTLQSHLAEIDQLFGARTVEEIWKRLEEYGSAWALDQLAIMKKMSPTSMKVSMRQLEYGSKLDFKDCFRMEYRMSQHFIKDHDFFEGVRAVLVEKDNAPKWRPPTLEEVTNEKVEWFFSRLPPEKELVIVD